MESDSEAEAHNLGLHVLDRDTEGSSNDTDVKHRTPIIPS